MPAQRSLRVWVLSDGRPGHYNQAYGIVRALQYLQPVETTVLNVGLRLGLARKLLRWRLNRKPRPDSAGLLRMLYRMDGVPPADCDLIVSAGGNTSFVNAWLAGVLGVPNAYAGSLRGLDASLFSVVLTLEPVAGADRNLVLLLPPNPITPEEIDARGAQLRARLDAGQQRYWTLLLGGNGAGFRYRRRDWLQLPRMMSLLSARFDIRWLITSSRRTGRFTERLLKGELDPRIVGAACWYGDGGRCDTGAYLGAAEKVFVTEDSMSMLGEAIGALRPVYSLRPAHALPDTRYARALMRFENQRLVCRHRLDEVAQRPELLQDSHCRVLQESPLLQLGMDLAKRLDLPAAAR